MTVIMKGGLIMLTLEEFLINCKQNEEKNECKNFKTFYEKFAKQYRDFEEYMINEREKNENLYGRPYKVNV